MTTNEIMMKIRNVLDDAKTGVLSTVDNNGYPRMRWMTPVVLDEWPNTLYAVTSPGSAKTVALRQDPRVSWLLQRRALDEIIEIKGRVNLVDNPSLKAAIMEAVGRRLTVFWKINPGTDAVVLETVIDSVSWFSPMKNQRETVQFGEEVNA